MGWCEKAHLEKDNAGEGERVVVEIRVHRKYQHVPKVHIPAELLTALPVDQFERLMLATKCVIHQRERSTVGGRAICMIRKQ
jgi:hypothetical protein